MIDLRTTYMGLELKNPIVASASLLCDSVDKIRLLEDHGIAAVVLPSLFEEQLIVDCDSVDADLSRGAEAFSESASFFTDLMDYNLGPYGYLELIRKAKESVSVPVTGPSSVKSAMTKDGPIKSDCTTPRALPSNDTSRSKAKPTRTTPRMKPTSKIEKVLICWLPSGVLALFAISGMNKTDSALCATPKSLRLPDGGFIIASPGCWVVRAVPITAFYFIPSAMTGFIANLFPYRNRVSSTEAFEGLEPGERKLSRPVLRGLGSREAARPLGMWPWGVKLRIFHLPIRPFLEAGSMPRTSHP